MCVDLSLYEHLIANNFFIYLSQPLNKWALLTFYATGSAKLPDKNKYYLITFKIELRRTFFLSIPYSFLIPLEYSITVEIILNS